MHFQFDLRNRSYLQSTLGFGKSIYDDGFYRRRLSEYLRVGFKVEIENTLLLWQGFGRLLASRFRDKQAFLTAAAGIAMVNRDELENELDALWYLANCYWSTMSFEPTIDDVVSDVVATSNLIDKQVKLAIEEEVDWSDSLFHKIGAVRAHSRTPIYVSYSQVVKDFRIRYYRDKELLLLTRE